MSIKLKQNPDRKNELQITRQGYLTQGGDYVHMVKSLIDVVRCADPELVDPEHVAEVLSLIKDCMPDENQANKMFDIDKRFKQCL